MPSSVIHFYRYDPGTRELLVVFRSGWKYVYGNVPSDVFAEMNAAFSKGEFFNRHIRDKYPFTRRDRADRPPRPPGRPPLRRSRHSRQDGQ
jgi:KTSC domain